MASRISSLNIYMLLTSACKVKNQPGLDKSLRILFSLSVDNETEYQLNFPFIPL